MANRRQIPFLHWHRNADGSETGWWKPSPRLRRMGWTNRKLGPRTAESQVLAAALALNAQLAEWEAQRTAGATAPAAPARRRFSDLLAAYRASADYADLAPATLREYEVRLRWLEAWALDGRLELAHLDHLMVQDLRETLLAPGKSRYKAAAILRVLRLLLNWAVGQRWIATNATDAVKIPAPPSRTTLLTLDEAEAASAAAAAAGEASTALGILIGIWSLQREADLLALTRMAWREFDNVAPADAAVLKNRHGKVMGFRLQQGKTGAWVDCPMPPTLHDRIEAAFARSQYLLHDATGTAPLSEKAFQRRARKALNAAGLPHAQFSDLRRSGLTMLSDLGAELSGITAISGHAVLGRRTILDTYMPGNTRSACAAMATALRTLASRQEKEKEA